MTAFFPERSSMGLVCAYSIDMAGSVPDWEMSRWNYGKSTGVEISGLKKFPYLL